jgi:hypothetical protein
MTNPCFIDLTLEVLEDLHTGSGTGGGDIDALVQRDRHGHPVIRASHLKGLLREAGEELIALAALQSEDLQTLLGTPGKARGALNLTALRLPNEAQSNTLVWGSTQRVENGRAPKPDTLRFIEHVAAGTRLSARLRLADAGRHALLDRLLKRIDRIGGARNRGSGLVKLTWQPAELTPGTVPSGAGTRVRLVLRNLEPLCLPATGHPGNLIKSQSFIRGQTLRGALMAWAIHNGRREALPLFERLSVGDALPLPAGCIQAESVLPMPLSILTDKPSGDTAAQPWWAGGAARAAAFDALGEVPDAAEKRKRPGAHEYLCRTPDIPHWQRYSPAMPVRLRNATPKRDSTEDAQLFSLEEIAEDTCFQADVQGADEHTISDFLATFAPVLTGTDWLALGRGGQPVGVVAATPRPPPPLPVLTDDWTLTLTSDAIVRGPWLGFLDNLSLEQLCQLAGVAYQAEWNISTQVVETAPVHGFNAVTGLTRAPALALRRGSGWRIQGANSAVLANALLAKGAIGERTDEGYGRFVIGLQPIPREQLGKPPRKPQTPQPNRNEALLAQARELARQRSTSGPSLSQLQWLRAQAGAVTTQTQLETLLTEIEQAPRRRPQGGKAWEHFPHQPLRRALAGCQTLDEQRRLIAYLVQWHVLSSKEAHA